MNPFLEIPIRKNHPRNASEAVGISRIKPGDIESYDDAGELGTIIFMKSGNTKECTLSFDQLDGAMISYVKCLKENPNKFGNLVVNMPKFAKIENPKTETVAIDV